MDPVSHSLTVILLGEVCRRLEDLRDEGGVDLPHGQVLDAVRVPVHVVTDALQRGLIEVIMTEIQNSYLLSCF